MSLDLKKLRELEKSQTLESNFYLIRYLHRHLPEILAKLEAGERLLRKCGDCDSVHQAVEDFAKEWDEAGK